MQSTHHTGAGREVAAVIMAAGKGTRMKDPTRAKVMYEIDGKPMIHSVVDLAYALEAKRVIVVVGHQAEVVELYLRESHSDIECVLQAQQLGTGHAVLQARESLDGFNGSVIVLSGDVPLLRRSTMESLLHHHEETRATATILTAALADPSGYGRIIRNSHSSVEKIIEHRDANDQERAINEINSGIYVFDNARLFDALTHINAHNAQNEYYLTDVFEYFWKNHWKVSALIAKDPLEIRGVNTPDQLEEARTVARASQRAAS
ncbi:MAG: NTP transferase domain-containing protein [Proteobacteria bacterium]|nr:NTP transferase domain-containing protein [Pseudomonadota bacterium]